jgi:cytochrome c biogenesis protein CcmG, thiol:disulfide interchange protein DsbE
MRSNVLRSHVLRSHVLRSGIDLGGIALGLRGVLLAAALAALSACGGAARAAPNTGDDSSTFVGQLAPDTEFAKLRGTGNIRLSSLRGKVVLLDFWASWCAPCQEEPPLLDDMAVRLKSKDIEIVGLSIDESQADAEQFLTRKSAWSLTLGQDPEQKIANQFKPPKMPTSYAIDRKGVVRQMNAGFEHADLEKIEAQLLELAAAN